MYTNQEASMLRQKFWISFGKYMAPIPSSTGEKVNWVNYRTGIKFLNFRMNAFDDQASIAIEFSHPDMASRELYFNHFKTFKKPLEEILEEKWQWEPELAGEAGNVISKISRQEKGIKVLDEKYWPVMITFLKKRIIGLDRFWNEYKDIFDMLT